MDAHTLGRAALAMYASLLLAIIVTAYMVGFARRRNMLDAPGKRRSHAVPTPRGGGLGLVVGSLVGLLLALHGQTRPPLLLFVMLAAAILVAVVGWIDDRRGLTAWPRLATHLCATLAFSAVLIAAAHWSWWWLVPLALAGAWSINLHNFMDGIDGILGLQLAFTGLLGALLCTLDGMPVLATAQLAVSAAASRVPRVQPATGAYLHGRCRQRLCGPAGVHAGRVMVCQRHERVMGGPGHACDVRHRRLH